MDKLNKIKSDIDKVSSDMEKISSGSTEGWEIANKIFAEYQKQNKRKSKKQRSVLESFNY